VQQKIILITGCSSGIGHDAALALAKRGHRVIASCRQQKDVDALLAKGFDSIQLDVTNSDSINTAFKQLLLKTGGRLDVLINNAGYGQAGALEDVPEEALTAQFATNVFGLMAVTRQAIPIMRLQGSGCIINISSILGLISMPFRGAYNASKHAVEAISDTLRLELKSSGIHVCTIEPGPIVSRFRETSIDFALENVAMEQSHFRRQYQHMLGNFRTQKAESIFTCKPEAVIKKLVHAIESRHPKAKYPVTFPTHLFVLLKRLLSVRMLDRVLLRISAKELAAK